MGDASGDGRTESRCTTVSGVGSGSAELSSGDTGMAMGVAATVASLVAGTARVAGGSSDDLDLSII